MQLLESLQFVIMYTEQMWRTAICRFHGLALWMFKTECQFSEDNHWATQKVSSWVQNVTKELHDFYIWLKLLMCPPLFILFLVVDIYIVPVLSDHFSLDHFYRMEGWR